MDIAWELAQNIDKTGFRNLSKQTVDVTKRFIRAMAKANDYVKNNKQGTVEVIQKYFEIQDAGLAEGIYKQVANAFGPEIPHDLLMDLFQSRTTPELGWPAGQVIGIQRTPDLVVFHASHPLVQPVSGRNAFEHQVHSL